MKLQLNTKCIVLYGINFKEDLEWRIFTFNLIQYRYVSRNVY